MRLSRFLCDNPAYPHPLDLPGRPDLEAGQTARSACHTPPDAVVAVSVAQRRRGRCARSWFNAVVVVVLLCSSFSAFTGFSCMYCCALLLHIRCQWVVVLIREHNTHTSAYARTLISIHGRPFWSTPRHYTSGSNVDVVSFAVAAQLDLSSFGRTGDLPRRCTSRSQASWFVASHCQPVRVRIHSSGRGRRRMSWAPSRGRVDVMAKRPQGLLNVGTLSARMAVLRSCALDM
jgi:hypothetical protein